MKNRVAAGAVVVAALGLAGCQGLNLGLGMDTAEPTSATLPPNPIDEQTLKAANIPVPQWRVGDTWEYSDGYALAVTDVYPDGKARFSRLDAPGQWMVRRGIFKEEEQSGSTHRLVVFRTDDPMRLFTSSPNQPISYVREYMRDKELVRHRTSWVIEGKERVQVPAGTFDCWVLVWRSQSLDSNWRGFERWWYAPELRHYVRMEYRYGEGQDSARVLMNYKLGDAPTGS